MVFGSNLYGGGNSIPVGDTLRITRTGFSSGVEATIFTRSGAGFISNIVFDGEANVSGVPFISNLKVTVDGAAERTLISTGFPMSESQGSAGIGQSLVFLISIKYQIYRHMQSI